MISKRLQNNIDSGLWAHYGHPNDDYIAAVGPSQESGDFIMTFHHGEMPAFNGETFKTLDELETHMRELEPDMRKWRTKA